MKKSSQTLCSNELYTSFSAASFKLLRTQLKIKKRPAKASFDFNLSLISIKRELAPYVLQELQAELAGPQAALACVCRCRWQRQLLQTGF
jgi:hypothetical protein